MEISKTFTPEGIENKWYAQWLAYKCFKSTPDHRTPYTIVIPPPNVTGVLHMGHMLNNTIQDVLIRRARMKGFNACWVPGTDHASIATEAKVVHLLREKGIKKSDLSREEFLAHAWEWKEKYGGIILEQLKKLGASCDWDRTRFTMEADLSDAVTDVFIDLYNKGLIYRGLRMINWDPSAKTTLSNEEVIYTEEQNNMYYIKYMLSDGSGHLPVATVRPETIPGDVAVCVNPNDERYQHLIGKTVIVPLVNREVPIIADEYVDIEFGTGALKITPAHDINDYEISKKHNLPVIDCLTESGTISEEAGIFVGLDRFEARKLARKQLEADGVLYKTEQITNQIGRSERTNAIVEPRLSLQWFLNMRNFMDKNPEVLSDVMDDKLKFYPPKFKNTYKHWIDNIKDWCISRQLWWGQRIPAWFDESGNIAVCKTEKEAQEILKTTKVRQEDDVVDTWFSSWLWPISVFDGFKDPENADINYYYPTNDLVTAPEIMFFWVMRMIMAGYEWKGEKPFKNVYYTGIVRDKMRRKMSKSLGNSPDPLDLIAKYGADGVRMGMLMCTPAGNDILFDESIVEQGRNFSNKIWNAFRLVKSWEIDGTIENPSTDIAIVWFQNRFNEVINQIDDDFSKFRLNEAMMAVYKLIWDDFCASYLEMVKPVFGQPIDKKSFDATIDFFDQILRLLSPFMPFIAEEIWQNIETRPEGVFLCTSTFPENKPTQNTVLEEGNKVRLLISEVRNLRSQKQISPKTSIKIQLDPSLGISTDWNGILKKMLNLDELLFSNEDDKNWHVSKLDTSRFWADLGDNIYVDEEISKLTKDLAYQEGFKTSVLKKLANEKFVQNAPKAVLDIEHQKLADAGSRIAIINEQLEKLKA